MRFARKKLVRKGQEYDYIEQLFPDQDEYVYVIVVRFHNVPAEVIITRLGLAMNRADGTCVRTNIRPGGLFPGKNSLSEDELVKVLDVFIRTGFEGKVYTQEEMEEAEFYEDD